MASVLRYFKRKIEPLRVCVASNPSPELNQIENSIQKQEDFEIDSKKVQKKGNRKRRFNIKLKRSIKSNLNECLKQNDSLKNEKEKENETYNNNNNNNNYTQSVTERMDISSNFCEEKSEILTPDTILFTSPVSSNLSSHFYESNVKTRIDYGTDSNFVFSPSNIEFFDTTHSNIDRKRASCSTYDPEYFPFESVSNSSAANNSGSSMVTYNTKYANSNYANEECLITTSGSLIRQPSISLSSKMQQSTPYCEVAMNKRNLQSLIKKSQTTNFDSITQLDKELDKELNQKEIKQDGTLKRGCRRSNTTYTVNGKSSRIAEYFTNLEKIKPLKRKALSRQASQNKFYPEKDCEKKSKLEEFANIYDDIDKLHDAFFNDDSLVNSNSNQENSNVNDDSNKNNNFYKNNYITITPPSSSTDCSNSTSSQDKSQNYSNISSEISNLKSNSEESISKSVEKVRRALSLPGLNQDSQIEISNVSKISDIKVSESELSSKTESTSNMTETLVNNSNKDSTENSLRSVDFVRGEHGKRASKKIKLMFKNVIKQQMIALNTLEKFYEAQVNILEEDRQEKLNLNPNDKEKINEYYDEQLKLLESRVQTNLKYVNNNKLSPKKEQSNEQAKKILTQRLSQLMLVKQIQQANNSQNTSKAFANLKTNFISQNSLLPSKVLLQMSQKESPDFTDFNETVLKDNMFKRNLSLPFKQCKHNPLMAQKQETTGQLFRRVSKSPRMSNLAYSTSRSKYNRQINTLTSSPLVQKEQVDLSNQQQQKVVSNTHFQYQKNSNNSKRFSTSIENVSQIKKTNENSLESTSSQNSETSVSRIENSIVGSKFAQIRRQNKSVSSIRSETVHNDDLQFKTCLNNSSLFNSNYNIFENANQHLYKYSAPRLSDGHIQYKIKMSAKNEGKQTAYYIGNNNYNLSETKVRSKSSILVIETEV